MNKLTSVLTLAAAMALAAPEAMAKSGASSHKSASIQTARSSKRAFPIKSKKAQQKGTLKAKRVAIHKAVPHTKSSRQKGTPAA